MHIEYSPLHRDSIPICHRGHLLQQSKAVQDANLHQQANVWKHCDTAFIPVLTDMLKLGHESFNAVFQFNDSGWHLQICCPGPGFDQYFNELHG